jgi:long-chain acyl-CoA synthetase
VTQLSDHTGPARQSNGRTLPQLLRDNARELPHRCAVKSKRAGIWQTKSWDRLYEDVALLARGLASIGLRRREVLASLSENIEEQLAIELAALSIGAITVSIYPDASQDEVAYAIDHSDAVIVLAQDQEQVDKLLACEAPRVRHIIYVDGRGLWSYADARLVSFDAIKPGNESYSASWLESEIDRGAASDVAVYCYTSGTTGRPKAAMLSHAFVLDNAYRLVGALDIKPGGKYLSYISPAWAAEQFFGVGLPLLAPLVVHFAEKPETIQTDLREIGPEFLMFTPRQWEMQASNIEARMMDAGPIRRRVYDWGLAQGRRRARTTGTALDRLTLWPLADVAVLRGVRQLLGLSRARAVLSGGAGLSPELFERFRAFGVPLGNLYGSTEMGLLSTHRPGSRNPWTLGSLMPSDPTVGKPIEAWVDEGGELRIRALAFSGYLKDPISTAEVGDYETGYHTGDAVRLDDNHELIFLDRIKDLRRLRGGQVYPPQFIENHLRASTLIRDAIVIGDEQRDRVVALINIDAEMAGRFAEHHGLAFGTFTELSQLPPIRREVTNAIERVNRLVDTAARVSAFANLPKQLDADESELTRSRKLRREQIHMRYSSLIESLYGDGSSIPTEIEVKYRDGTSAMLKTEVALNRIGQAV